MEQSALSLVCKCPALMLHAHAEWLQRPLERSSEGTMSPYLFPDPPIYQCPDIGISPTLTWWSGRGSWLQLLMSLVMLSISRNTEDCNSGTFWPQRLLTRQRPLLSKHCTIAIYCAMWNARHHYWNLTACTNRSSEDTAGPTQHCTDHHDPSTMPATSGCLKWSLQ